MDKKMQKKVVGKGRGRGSKPEGPWVRSKKLDVKEDVRAPKAQDEQFILTESSFPPLPGAETNIPVGQFSDAPTTEESETDNEENRASTPDVDREENCHHQATKVDPQNENIKSKDDIDQQGSEVQDTIAVKADSEVKILNTNDIDQQGRDSQDIVAAKADCDMKIQNKNDIDMQGNDVLDTVAAKADCEQKIQHRNVRAENHNEVETKNINTQVDAELVANSNLSPFAEEFVPRWTQMNPTAQSFIPSTSLTEANNNPRGSVASINKINVNDKQALLADLEETVQFVHANLIETPASFDQLMGVVTPHFMKYMENPELPGEIVKLLFSYAVQDPLFSYFSVRILVHLIRLSNNDSPILRTALLTHTQAEVQQINLATPSVNSVSMIQPYLSFLSELYIQLEVGGRRLVLIGRTLMGILTDLLHAAHVPAKERLKVVITTVKLTGLSFDEDDPSLLDELFVQLEKVKREESPNLDDRTICLADNILVLRNLKWGKVEPDYLPSNDDEDVCNDTATVTPSAHEMIQMGAFESIPYDPNLVYSPGVFYGPDGQPMGYDEQLFLELETNALSNLNLQEQESPISVEDYDEAYNEFLMTIPGHLPQ